MWEETLDELQLQAIYPFQLLLTAISRLMRSQALNTATTILRQDALTWQCKSLRRWDRKPQTNFLFTLWDFAASKAHWRMHPSFLLLMQSHLNANRHHMSWGFGEWSLFSRTHFFSLLLLSCVQHWNTSSPALRIYWLTCIHDLFQGNTVINGKFESEWKRSQYRKRKMLL